jgi:hypothetical protein
MERIIFYPGRRLGLAFHLGAILVLTGGAVYGLYRASQASIGPIFLLALLPAMLAVVLVPILAYRAYALISSSYILQRDGVFLQWGLRIEEISMTTILWVRPAHELRGHLPLPLIYWPGAVVGIRRLQAAGTIEFMASSSRKLILIATPGHIFAISPDNPEAFLSTFQQLSELGSLSPITARSVKPSLLLGRVWNAPMARYLILAGILLDLALLVWVSLAIPGHESISLGFRPEGVPRDPVPAVQLLLLPVLSSLIYLSDLILGMIFYRQDEHHPLAYLSWANSMIITLIFLAGVFFIIRTY